MRMRTAALAAVLALTACEGTQVRLGSPAEEPVPTGEARELTAEACGFQLLYFIPIAVNNRLQRAYRQVELQAPGEYIADVRISERWMYGFAGTLYCTTVEAKAIRKT